MDSQYLVTIVTTLCVCVQAPESFYEDASQYDDTLTFDDMNLSRPILKVNHLTSAESPVLTLLIGLPQKVLWRSSKVAQAQ